MASLRTFSDAAALLKPAALAFAAELEAQGTRVRLAYGRRPLPIRGARSASFAVVAQKAPRASKFPAKWSGWKRHLWRGLTARQQTHAFAMAIWQSWDESRYWTGEGVDVKPPR